MDPIELKHSLNMFSGSDEVYHFSALYPRVFLTAGAQYLAEKAEAFWLMDLIASHQLKAKVYKEEFQVWTIRVYKDKSWTVWCENGNRYELCSQTGKHTDFPLEVFQLYAIRDAEYLTILLPNEK